MKNYGGNAPIIYKVMFGIVLVFVLVFALFVGAIFMLGDL
jgi:hypothetical protein